MSPRVVHPDLFVDALMTDGNMELAIRNHQHYQTVVPGRIG
jgi:hypothetical protein